MKTETIAVIAALITAAGVNLDAGRETREWVEDIKADIVSVLLHQSSVGERLGYAVSEAETKRHIAEVEAAARSLQKDITEAVIQIQGGRE